MLLMSQTDTSFEPYEAARLRAVSLRDTDKLVALYQKARKGREETRQDMLSWLEHGGGLLLETQNADFLCAIRWRESGSGWQVDRIATLPEARGLGYGRWLMTKLEALAIRNNIPCLTLTLDEARENLTSYYTRMGYRVVEEHADEVVLDKRVGGMWQVKG